MSRRSDTYQRVYDQMVFAGLSHAEAHHHAEAEAKRLGAALDQHFQPLGSVTAAIINNLKVQK